jgi:uncharacterized protein with von Willebrand factor type A (vWA) domain
MIECRTAGFGWDEIYNWNVDEFIDVYHALQRNDTRVLLRNFSATQQAFGGDKKSVTAFIDQVSAWLPAEERNGGKKTADDFVEWMRKSGGAKIK